MDLVSLLWVFLAFAAGGMLKGAVGAGAPLLAVPLMAAIKDVPFAVAVFVLPNIFPNIWQYWHYRYAIAEKRFVWSFALSGGIGAGLGTIALYGLRSSVLQFAVGGLLALYVLFRLLKPKWRITRQAAKRVVVPTGLVAGALQGATGLSAPVSLTFLNAIGLERREFMATVSLFFVALGVVQLPAQIAYGIMTPERFALSALALLPLLAFMPVGAWIGRHLSQQAFERLVFVLLTVLAARLIWSGLI